MLIGVLVVVGLIVVLLTYHASDCHPSGVGVRRDIRRVIVGLQGSGKTVLAKHIIERYRKQGVSTLVIDYQHDATGRAIPRAASPTGSTQRKRLTRSCGT